MRLLLDTHAFLWFVNGDERLDPVARGAIEDARNDVLVSVASIWEMSIKSGIGKLQISEPLDQFVARELQAFQVLPITAAHALQTARLPLHHRDPFDRMLAAICVAESLQIVSVDEVFDAYGIGRLWNVAVH
jgi:PIN domain nuclease of toxin-antitoxin system